MVLLSVLTSATSSYLLCSNTGTWSWSGVTRLIVTSGLSLVVTIQWRILGSLVSLVTAAALSHLELSFSQDKDHLVYLRTSGAQTSDEKKLSVAIENIIANCSSLKNPKYIPTFWSSNKWANLALYFVKQLYDKSSLQSNNFTRELIRLSDGGTVSIDYAETESQIPADAPVVIFLHTITGSGKEVGHYMRSATKRGWHSCVFNRRGHAGVKLTSPRFNIVGDAHDAVTMVEHVQAKFPDSYIAMVGISAGCGLLMSYLGSFPDTPIRVAAALCPAYDIERAFRLAVNFPSMDQHILGSMKRLFLQQNTEILCSKSEDTFIDCSNAKTVHEFIRVHYPFAGYKTIEEYYIANNPIDWIPKIQTPMLLVNSEDDIVCLAENIREDLVRSQAGALLLRTNKGSHISFNEGLFGQGCYLSRITMDFLETARRLDV